MRTSIEPLEGNKVKVSVEVDEVEVESAVDAAFTRIAREVRIPGFRPGKAPRKVLEARIGGDYAREEALRSALPDYYEQAVRDNEVDVIAAPEFDITDGEKSGAVSFDAVVEIRPEIELSGYGDLRIVIPSPTPSDDDVDEQLETLRGQHGELETVNRSAIDGDRVSIDISGTQGGEELDGLTADDYLYELGSEAVVPEIDQHLRGAKPGDIFEFDADHPDADEEEGLQLRILVKEVKAKVLPDLDDAFASEASEFDTLDELRSDIRENLVTLKAAQAQRALYGKTTEALAELVDDEPPEALVNHQMQHQLQELAMSLGAQGMELDQYFAMSGQSQDEIAESLRVSAIPAVKVDLAIRAIAEAEDIVIDDEAIDAELAAAAEQMDRPLADIRADFERAGQISAVRSDLRKRAALEWLVDHVDIVDDDGQPIDRNDLEIAETDTEADPVDGADGDDDTEDDDTRDEEDDE